LDWLLNKLLNPRTRRGLLAFIPSDQARQQVEAARQAGEQFFRSLLAWVYRQPRSSRGPARPASESFRVREPGIVPDVLSEELIKLASRVDEAARNLEDEQKIEFTALSDRARQLALGVKHWLGQSLEGQVYWA